MKKNTADKLREAALSTGLLTSREKSTPVLPVEKSLEPLSSFASSSSEEVGKPISNIGHLVKRKRKPDEDNVPNIPLEKKPKADMPVDSGSSAEVVTSSEFVNSSAKSKNCIGGKNDSDVSSTISFLSEEQHHLSPVLANEVSPLTSLSKTAKSVNKSNLELASKSGNNLSNGTDGAKEVIAAKIITESKGKTSNSQMSN